PVAKLPPAPAKGKPAGKPSKSPPPSAKGVAPRPPAAKPPKEAASSAPIAKPAPGQPPPLPADATLNRPLAGVSDSVTLHDPELTREPPPPPQRPDTLRPLTPRKPTSSARTPIVPAGPEGPTGNLDDTLTKERSSGTGIIDGPPLTDSATGE